MEIVNIPTSLLKQYGGNVKKHPKSQIEKICDSIRQFGMNQPIAVDEDNMIIAGHGRFLACMELGMEEVPCIVLDHMTEQQKKAYILVDNKLNMETGFDMKALQTELDSITEFHMDDFGFDLDFEVPDWKDVTQVKTFGFENFEKMYDVPSEGRYDIPIISPVTEMPEVTEWQGFNYVLSDKSPDGKGVHFFIHDYQFTRVWNTPDKYIEPLKRYEAVLTPDFSPYTDMPEAMRIYNHYRKHWLGAYWQSKGINVIPTITWSDEKSLKWCFDGEPHGGIVAVSTVSIMNQPDYIDFFYKAWDIMHKRLKPKQVILYGHQPPELDGDFVRIPSFAEKRFG